MILMVILPIVAHAQDEEYLVNKMPDISMTSPLSSQFNRFEFYPVSKATGVVDISIPLFTAALTYIIPMQQVALGANLIQAQRDFFGAHTFKRVDKEGVFHHHWE